MGRAEAILLHGEFKIESPARHAAVVVADRVVVGAHHQADLTVASVRDVGEHEVEKRTADRNHRLESRSGHLGLLAR